MLHILCTCLHPCLLVRRGVFSPPRVCVCIQVWLSAFPPTLASNTVIDNRRKGEGSADKEAECADQSINSDKSSEECGLRQGCSESRYTINCLAWLADQHSSVFISSLLLLPLLRLLLLSPSFHYFFFAPLFFRGLSAIKAERIDFLILSFPSFLLFNTPLPLPTPRSPNQYSICMYTGIKYKHTL